MPAFVFLEIGQRIKKGQTGRVRVGILRAVDIRKARGKVFVAHPE